MLLGQRLLQSKLVTIEQVQMALQLQVVHGGRIGSCLLKRGFIELDALSAELSRHTGAPAAKLKHFDGVDQETLLAIPAAIALKHRAVPLARVTRGGKELLVALRDPHDVAAVDEIAFVAGARVHVFIAPELVIHRYLERYYHVRPEQEFPLMAHQQRTSAKGGRKEAITLPPSPEPISLPSETADEAAVHSAATIAAAQVAAVMNDGANQRPRSSGLLPHPATWLKAANGVPASGGAPPPPALTPLQEQARAKSGVPLAPAVDFVEFNGAPDPSPWTEGQPPILLEEPVEMPNAPLPEELNVDVRRLPPEVASGPWEPAPLADAIIDAEAPVPLTKIKPPSNRPAPLSNALSNAPAAFVPPMLRPPWETAEQGPPTLEDPKPTDAPLSCDETCGAIGAAAAREDVGEAIARFLRGRFGVGLVFIVKDEIAFGWTGFADDVDRDLIESIMVPMNSPSLLALAFEKKAAFKGSPTEAASSAQTHFYKLLKTEPPAEAVVVPICVKDRVVNLIYAHPDHGESLPPSALEDLKRIATAASEAFIALIKKRKSMF